MKILQLLCFPLYGSGSGLYVRRLSQELAGLGHSVAIVCPDDRQLAGVQLYPVKLPLNAAFTGHPEWPESRLYSDITGSELNDIQEAFQKVIIHAVENFKPDVIHVHHAANLSWIANYIRAVYQIDYLITSHNTDILNAIVDKRYIPLTQDALARADFIIAVSVDTRDRLTKIFGKGLKLAAKTRVISVGVDLTIFRPDLDTSQVDAAYNLTNKPVVLFTGKLLPHKGTEYLIRAAREIKAEILIVGGGSDEARLRGLALRLNVTNVHFLGYITQHDDNFLAQLYARANVTVIPSVKDEGVPMTAIESLAAGTPVVATNKGGIPLVVRHLKTGLLIRPRSATAIIEAVNQILNDPKLTEHLSLEGRRLASEQYGWPAITRTHLRYYEKTVEYTQKRRQTKRAAFIKPEEYQEEKSKLVDQQQFHRQITKLWRNRRDKS